MGCRLGLGVRLAGIRKSATLGSEKSIAATSGGWTLAGATPPTQNGTGIHFVAASNTSAVAVYTVPGGLQDGATYEITITLANVSLGGCRVLLYSGANRVSSVATNRTTNGTFTERATLSGNVGSFTNQIRIQAIGSGTNNTFDVTAISVKQVFGG